MVDDPATTGADPAAAEPRRVRRPRWDEVAVVLPVLVYAVLVWRRRWMSDDGLIVLRTVRQVVAGHGPVFNTGERVEASTSTLWTALLTLPGLLPGSDTLNWAAVVLGLLLSVAGLALAVDGARRLVGAGGRVLPFGALLVVVMPPFWDFGTSGLETGLIFGWLGLTWWLLVRRLDARRAAGEEGVPGGLAWPTAVVIGLAPLVRPDLALFGLCAAAALAVLEWPRGWRTLLGLAAAAAALPLAYEVFRAGYYGLLVPSTALAKEAAHPRWQQGFFYLSDLVGTYHLGVPMAAVTIGALTLLLALVPAVRPVRPGRPGRLGRPGGLAVAVGAVVAAPVVASALLALYVTRVGGDFMHARMLLPSLFSVLLPVMVVPVRRALAPAGVVLVAWSLLCLVGFRPDYTSTLGPHFISNERAYYVDLVGVAHPITGSDYRGHPIAPEGAAEVAAAPPGVLALRGSDRWVLYPEAPGTPSTIVWLNLGVTGELAPLDVRVLDAVGLVNPLAAHIPSEPDGRIGHDKELPSAWIAADSGVAGGPGLDAAEVAAARTALACPATRELLDSVRAPLSADRFWANLTGAVARSSYRYPSDPFAAARCPASPS